jgi:hypothetical protein
MRYVQDVPVVNGEPTSYLWQNVPSGRDYYGSVSARNWAGEGPSAMTYVSTPEEPEGMQLLLIFFVTFYELSLHHYNAILCVLFILPLSLKKDIVNFK